jgi:ribonuclease D
MARITISMPDELKALLEQHAQEHETTVSETVQTALKNHLTSTPPAPAAPPPPPEPAEREVIARIKQLEDHVAALTYETEHMRQGLAQTAVHFKTTTGARYLVLERLTRHLGLTRLHQVGGTIIPTSISHEAAGTSPDFSGNFILVGKR